MYGQLVLPRTPAQLWFSITITKTVRTLVSGLLRAVNTGDRTIPHPSTARETGHWTARMSSRHERRISRGKTLYPSFQVLTTVHLAIPLSVSLPGLGQTPTVNGA